MSQKIARKKICVNRDIQGTILGRMAKYWILYHLGLWCILFAMEFFHHIIGGVLMGRGLVLSEFCVKFASEHWFMLTAPILLFPAILWDMLHLTHRVAGPLVRFRNALQQLAAGQSVEKIKLRNGDLLTEFQESFNEFLDSDFLRSSQSVWARNKLDRPTQEESILKGVATLNTELRGTGCQTAQTAIH